jgi:hypothetical protein
MKVGGGLSAASSASRDVQKWRLPGRSDAHGLAARPGSGREKP